LRRNHVVSPLPRRGISLSSSVSSPSRGRRNGGWRFWGARNRIRPSAIPSRRRKSTPTAASQKSLGDGIRLRYSYPNSDKQSRTRWYEAQPHGFYCRWSFRSTPATRRRHCLPPHPKENTAMHYKTIVLEMLQDQYPTLHEQLRASRTLLLTL